jgi:hypothetical protein
MRRCCRQVVNVGCVASLLLAGCEGPLEGQYDLVETGIPLTAGSVVGFNADGEIALSNGVDAFRYSGGTLTELGAEHEDVPVHAKAMNERGDVIAWRAEGESHSYKWLGGTTTPIPMPGELGLDINAAGDVLLNRAVFSNGELRFTAYRIRTTAGVDTVAVPATLAWSGAIVDINDSREVLGVAATNGVSRPVVLSAVARAAPAGECPIEGSWYPVALNNAGAYVGSSVDESCLVRPGHPTTLLPFVVPGDGGRLQLNDAGAMIGRIGTRFVIAPDPETVLEVEQLFARDADRRGWNLGGFVALNSRSDVVAFASKDGRNEWVVLRRR